MIISQKNLDTILSAIREEYRDGLRNMAKTKERPFGLTKKTIDDLAAGHDDGVCNVIKTLRAKGLLLVED